MEAEQIRIAVLKLAVEYSLSRGSSENPIDLANKWLEFVYDQKKEA